MRYIQLALLFFLACVASIIDKEWITDCQIHCIRSADRYKKLKTKYPNRDEMRKRLTRMCENEDRKNRRIPVCSTVAGLILNSWKGMKVEYMDMKMLCEYCKYGCNKYGPKK
ncbi:hypothetical protein ANCCAN_00671 [Ancylostoma caninum]|uniref:Uncharacterized protein n=1 Tax=Ancylostoma caninum TaxID=29170 RepID=A0A368HBQ5_ANCCA|nr:hypothetical protein ANCCAN_00671 [Ancylostoma caninum]